MPRPNRWILLGSGGLAAVIAAGACLMLLDPTPRTVRKQADSLASYSVSEPPAAAEMAPPPSADKVAGGERIAATAAIAINLPQLAYSYTLGYRLPAGAIAGAQQAHLDLCNRLGQRCQLVAMQRASADDGVSQASLKLRVASDLAQTVSANLTRLVGQAGGRAVDTQVIVQDVSKDLVDTGARIRQREILVARLTEMLRGRQGRVSELVEAERSVAQAQEELDQAKGWLSELSGRVAYSDFTIAYTPTTAPVAAPTRQGFFGQLGDAVMQSGAAVAGATRTLLVLIIFLAPWLAIATILGLLARPVVRRWQSAGLAPMGEDA
ncbi:DUF4349 domain-containing protein [Sphingomonas sp. NPDC092331]|jgi:hypothetical protein|uniref:DUF4349 domain-containing protein n=1 Tax=unclassified Sphingomonas TaxID=196159 RepID=UPI0031F4D162